LRARRRQGVDIALERGQFHPGIKRMGGESRITGGIELSALRRLQRRLDLRTLRVEASCIETLRVRGRGHAGKEHAGNGSEYDGAAGSGHGGIVREGG
jgi:hypothetical protein